MLGLRDIFPQYKDLLLLIINVVGVIRFRIVPKYMVRLTVKI